MIRGMGEIYSITHKAIEEIFDSPVECTEKVDGSFFSFAMINGELEMRSKGQKLHKEAPSSGMFLLGMQEVEKRDHMLHPGWIYRGEYLSRPKHNSLAYDRVPLGHVALFDIELSEGEHAASTLRGLEAIRLGFSSVPVLYEGMADLELVKKLLDTPSFLGGKKVEGVVVKNFKIWLHGHPLMGKLVSEEFKEVHQREWKTSNPGGKDIIETLIDRYRTDARWRKAIQHLRDEGRLTNSPQDIGPLLKEIGCDIIKEEESTIKEALWTWAWPRIQRGTCRGFPEWYKEFLLNQED